jgi:hypothetical protein
VAIGFDASRFDQHVSEEALEFEHSIYQSFYPGDRYLRKMLKWTRNQTGYARADNGYCKYTVKGMRASGHPHTALGNCTLMASMMYCWANKVEVKMSLVNDGDDCVAIMEQCDMVKFLEGCGDWFMNMGFHMKVEKPVYVLEHIEFCQSHPVFDGNEYIMVRDPRIAMAKDAMSVTHLQNNKTFERWMSAVGQGGMSLTGGIPVWQNFYATFVRSCNGANPLEDPTLRTGMKMLGKGMFRKYCEPTAEARLSFYLAFDIPPDAQIAIENYHDTIQHSWWERCGEEQLYTLLPYSTPK